MRETLILGAEPYDDQRFAEQMADLGVEIIRRKKEEVPVTDNKKAIEKLLDEKGLRGLLPMGTINDIPKEALEEWIRGGFTNIVIAKRLGTTSLLISRLRKLYDLPGKPGSKPRDAAAPKTKVGATEVLPEPEFLPSPETEPLPTPESRWAPVPGCPEPVLWQEQAPHDVPCLRCACETKSKPLLDLTDTGIVLAPLAAGVSKMLERIGEGQVRLTITVERV